MAKICLIAGCEKNAHGAKYCAMHGKRLRLYGDASYLSRTENGLPQKFFEQASSLMVDECIPWPFCINSITGYGDIRIEKKTYRVHNLMCRRVHGTPPTKKHETAHSCGVRKCINHRHLRWATRISNQADRIIHGTTNRGERQHCCRLTSAQVLEIKKIGTQHSPTVAEKYNVAPRTIRDIWNGKTWAWLSLV